MESCRASIHTTSKYIERMVPLIHDGLGFFETFKNLLGSVGKSRRAIEWFVEQVESPKADPEERRGSGYSVITKDWMAVGIIYCSAYLAQQLPAMI